MELLIALILFIGMVAIWFVLPDGALVAAEPSHSQVEINNQTIQQPA